MYTADYWVLGVLFLIGAFIVGVFMKINPHRGAIASGILNVGIVLPSAIFLVRQEPTSMAVAFTGMAVLFVAMAISQQVAYLVVSDLYVVNKTEGVARSKARVMTDRHLMTLVIIAMLSVAVIDLYPIVPSTVLFGIIVGALRFNFGDNAHVDQLQTY